MQSRAMSLVESIANIVVGFAVAVSAQLIVFPLFGIKASLLQNLGIGSVFTAVSLARSYCIRRLFNRLCHSRAEGDTSAHGEAPANGSGTGPLHLHCSRR